MAIRNSAYDVMMKAYRGKKFFLPERDGPGNTYEIKDLFYDSNEESPLKCWYFDCTNLKTGKREKVPIVSMRYLEQLAGSKKS